MYTICILYLLLNYCAFLCNSFPNSLFSNSICGCRSRGALRWAEIRFKSIEQVGAQVLELFVAKERKDEKRTS